MPAAAPRLNPQLLDRLEWLARGELPYADVRRLLVAHARELGVPPPSYEHVRRLVKASRSERESDPGVLPIALEVAVGLRHGNELVDAMRKAADAAL